MYDRRAGSTSAAPARAVVAYDVIANPPSQAARTGQAYNILNRGQAGGGTSRTGCYAFH